MIFESYYWKKELIKDADILNRWSKKKSTERGYVLFEKKIFVSAFSIRKLIEAEKIGPDFPMWNLSVDKFLKKTKKKIDYMNNHRTEEFYDLNKPVKDSINIQILSDILIHSYIFQLGLNELEETDAFFFISDKYLEKCLLKMDLEKFINILKWIGHSDAYSAHQTRDSNEKSGFKIKRKYCFDDCIPKKYLPKTPILYQSKHIEDCLSGEKSLDLL